ncbi:hypothetical protein Lal_00020078 [Lupinus albus]|uniref:Uncharacterized protein n=1 Tax=Lupinus albus TaxID=3870 RepID=A0A6A4Q5Y9_LUPAL|nr:hypothetical protein Lalb_Chr08g0243091 [Lupinus albus]KAF1871286.1 hypothetical protein Lal_00020078 [Lupinus albus]
MATDTLKLNSCAQDGSSNPMFDSLALKKKIDNSIIKSVTTTVTKSEVKPKPSAAAAASITVSKTTTTKVRERKVYSLPGQKHDPPEQKEPLRIFYESLSKQIPTSEMAEFWLMEHGLLSPEKAKKAFEKKQRKQKEIRTGIPVKTETSSQKQQQASKNGDIKAKKRIVNESDDEDEDFILSHKRRKL